MARASVVCHCHPCRANTGCSPSRKGTQPPQSTHLCILWCLLAPRVPSRIAAGEIARDGRAGPEVHLRHGGQLRATREADRGRCAPRPQRLHQRAPRRPQLLRLGAPLCLLRVRVHTLAACVPTAGDQQVGMGMSTQPISCQTRTQICVQPPSRTRQRVATGGEGGRHSHLLELRA